MCPLMAVTVCHQHLESQPRYDKILVIQQGIFVGCIYAPYKVNPNIFRFYFDFLDIFHHPSMHPLFHNIYEFYLIFYDFISSFIIYNNHLYLRQHFLF